MAEPKPVCRHSPSISFPEKSSPAVPSAAPSPLGRRQPLICKGPKKSTRARFAEMAGETAAECAAIWCCCPCGLVNLFLQLTVKLPMGLCLRALRRKKKLGKAKKEAIAGQKVGSFSVMNDDLIVLQRGPLLTSCSINDEVWLWKTPSPEFYELEKEMLAKFCAAAGFGRSPSQRERELLYK